MVKTRTKIKLKKEDRRLIDIVKLAVEEVVVEKKLVSQDDLKYFPTREEYYMREDKMMSELKAIREEITILSQHDRDHFDDIDNLKKIHPNNTHLAFA